MFIFYQLQVNTLNSNFGKMHTGVSNILTESFDPLQKLTTVLFYEKDGCVLLFLKEQELLLKEMACIQCCSGSCRIVLNPLVVFFFVGFSI